MIIDQVKSYYTDYRPMS